MLVTCQICKKKIDRDSAYKRVLPSGANKYYCSEEEYLERQNKNNLVACQICKKKIDKTTAYRLFTAGKNQYFCNKQEYIEHQTYLKDKDVVGHLLEEIIDFPCPYGTIAQRLAKWYNPNGMKLLKNYLQDNKIEIGRALAKKSFATQGQKAAYFCGIAGSGLNNYRLPAEPIIKVAASSDNFAIEDDEEISVKPVRTPKRKKLQRRSMSELGDLF